MLPNPAIQGAYDKVTWLYVYRDFSGNKKDRAAERISLRFGVTSWPQLFLVDPETFEIKKHTGRSVESFLAAVAATRVGRTQSLQAWERTKAAEERAIALERASSGKLARKYIDDEDIVVRNRALSLLAKTDRKAIVKRANELLQVPSDPFRYEVCKVLQETADPAAADALEAIVKRPQNSLNPNVLRIRAVQALSTCGDASSIEAIAPFAQSGVYFNGLTGVSVDALAAIAERHKKARRAVRAALKKGYPKPPSAGDARSMRACVGLAKRIHRAIGEKRPFPKVYDEKARAKLMK